MSRRQLAMRTMVLVIVLMIAAPACAQSIYQDRPVSNTSDSTSAAAALVPKRSLNENQNDDVLATVLGDYPALPPDPYEEEHEPLPPIGDELWNHGGSYLYQPEGDRLNWPGKHEGTHYYRLRLPEDWQQPKPVTLFTDFLGADPIFVYPKLKWPGKRGYAWEPRFVGYGGYSLFGLAFEEDGQRNDAVGHQLLLDFDLQLTGTERFHVQYRPIGRENTGGSFYRFSDPDGYIDNSTGTPDRYWVEFELASVLGGFVDPFHAWDFNCVAGKFPFALHNQMLMNDEVLGFVISKNTIFAGPLSNLNVQVLYAPTDVDAFAAADAALYAVHVSADHRGTFWEATYAFVGHENDSSRDTHYAALSRTKFFGPVSLAARALFKVGDEGGRGSGQLIVLETNWTRKFHGQPCGVEHGVFYCNAFGASDGWNPISGGNFNRLSTSFEVNPLVRIAAGQSLEETYGVSAGVQLFRHHDDESFVPEVAFQSAAGTPVWGVGLRYLRKTGPRTFVEVLGVANFSDDSQFEREGIFTAYNILF